MVLRRVRDRYAAFVLELWRVRDDQEEQCQGVAELGRRSWEGEGGREVLAGSVVGFASSEIVLLVSLE